MFIHTCLLTSVCWLAFDPLLPTAGGWNLLDGSLSSLAPRPLARPRRNGRLEGTWDCMLNRQANALLPRAQARPTGAKPAGDVVMHRDLPYREGGSPRWKLDLALPGKATGKPRPAILVIHGGGWIEGDKSSFSRREVDVPGNVFHFAEIGFVAATMNYRLAGEAPFPAALEDCKNAVRWLRAHAKDYNLDPGHIGAFGNSAGGHLALMLAMTDNDPNLEGDGPFRDQSSRVQSAVSDSGPIDLLEQHRRGVLRHVCHRFLGGPPDGERLAVYKRASPSALISPRVPPLLLVYGVEDAQVPVDTADRFVLALGQAGLKDITYYRLARVDHCPYSLIRVPALRPVVDEFFDRTLKGPQSGPRR
jgi:acetyl esterase/lipase